MSDFKIEFVRVPYWRTLRPRWVWWLLGFGCGGGLGFSVGVALGHYVL